MYAKTFWKDQIKDSSGKVIQAGTPVDQTVMNNIELGVFEAQVTQDINAIINRLQADEAKEAVPLIMKNQALTSGNNSISLPTPRNTTTYAVIPVLQAAGSAPIAVTATQKNGFTVNAASTCTVSFIVTGGML